MDNIEITMEIKQPVWLGWVIGDFGGFWWFTTDEYLVRRASVVLVVVVVVVVGGYIFGPSGRCC
jgi:hypothetical protein